MRPIHVGLLGYGLAGQVFHAPLIALAPGLKLQAVASSRTEQIARELPGVAVEPTAEALLARDDIELIIVATPNDLHFPQAMAALQAGKHVVIDKPFALSLADADALIAMATRQRRLLSVFQNRRWDSGFLTARAVIASGRLGEVFYYEAHFDRFRPMPKPGWREQPGAGAGVFLDLGAHLVDQVLCLFGMPDAVSADIQPQRPEARVDDYFHLILHYGRRRAVLHASCLTALPGPSLQVHGDGGSLLVHGQDNQEAILRARLAGTPSPNAAVTATLADAAGSTAVPVQPGDYPAYYAAIAQAIAQDTPPPVLATEARQALAVMLAARASAESGQRIALE
ncbi:MAG: oxidoreductase [Sphingomonadales bacterium]